MALLCFTIFLPAPGAPIEREREREREREKRTKASINHLHFVLVKQTNAKSFEGQKPRNYEVDTHTSIKNCHMNPA